MKVSLATPDKVIFKMDGVESVKLAAHKGNVEILPRHTNYISLILPGEVSVKASDQSWKKFEVSDGIAKVESGAVSLLCTSAKALST